MGPWLVVVTILVASLARNRVDVFASDDVRLWATLFVSISVQALPFLALGVAVSGLVGVFVSPAFVQRVVPRRAVVAVPVAGVAGMALPGCECGSVPIAGRLIRNGTPPAAALTFLLAAPAINPVVMIATAVAFPGDHRVVLARFVASLAAAIGVGAWWANRTGNALIAASHDHDHGGGGRWARFAATAAHDLTHAGGYLIVGAAVAATLQLVVPRSVVDSAAGNEVVAVITMATLAIVLSICSEADAFVAAGMPQFSLSSRLVFLVVGPVIDVKLIAMHAGVFGRRFALVFAPVTVMVAVVAATIVGQVLL